jgi:type I restriction enzyme R subunit
LEGRTGQIEGLDPAEAPFYDLILIIAYNGSEVSNSSQSAIKDAVKQIYEEFQNTIDIVNFWQQKHEVRQLNARLKKILALTNEDPLINSREQIANEVLSLAKNRHNEILSEVDHGKHTSS